MFSFFSNLVKARKEWLSKNTTPNLAPIYNGTTNNSQTRK